MYIVQYDKVVLSSHLIDDFYLSSQSHSSSLFYLFFPFFPPLLSFPSSPSLHATSPRSPMPLLFQLLLPSPLTFFSPLLILFHQPASSPLFTHSPHPFPVPPSSPPPIFVYHSRFSFTISFPHRLLSVSSTSLTSMQIPPLFFFLLFTSCSLPYLSHHLSTSFPPPLLFFFSSSLPLSFSSYVSSPVPSSPLFLLFLLSRPLPPFPSSLSSTISRLPCCAPTLYPQLSVYAR